MERQIRFPLRQAARTENPDIISQTFNTLIELSQDKGEDRDIRLAAIHGIGFLVAEGDPELAGRGIAILREEIRSEDRIVRDAAISNLSIVVPNPFITEQVFETLNTLARDNRADNRVAVGFVLGNIIRTTDDPLIARKVVSVISILLEDPMLASRISQVLTSDYPYYINDNQINDNPEVVSELFAQLASLLSQDNPYANEAIAGVLGNIAWSIDDTTVADRAIAALLPFVNHDNAVVRQSVIRSLAVIAAKTNDPVLASEVVNALLPLLENEDDVIKSSAADGLGRVMDVVGDPQVAAHVSEALEKLLGDDSDYVRYYAFSAYAQACSWLDAQSLLSQLKNPTNKQKRDIARSALFLAALRDPAQLASIKEDLEPLRDAREPFVRIAAAQTLEMFNVAAMVHAVVGGSMSLSRAQSYLRELISGSSYSYPYYYGPYGPPPSSFRPSASGHIQFAVREALTELDLFEQAQIEDEP